MSSSVVSGWDEGRILFLGEEEGLIYIRILSL